MIYIWFFLRFDVFVLWILYSNHGYQIHASIIMLNHWMDGLVVIQYMWFMLGFRHVWLIMIFEVPHSKSFFVLENVNDQKYLNIGSWSENISVNSTMGVRLIHFLSCLSTLCGSRLAVTCLYGTIFLFLRRVFNESNGMASIQTNLWHGACFLFGGIFGYFADTKFGQPLI